jgi:hypothetical protein
MESIKVNLRDDLLSPKGEKMGLTDRPSNKGTTDKITREVYAESMDTKRKHLETLKEELAKTKKKIKKDNKSGWIAFIAGGIIAGTTVQVLNANGIYTGFVPTVLFWLAIYWVVKKIVERMAESQVWR